MPRTMLIGRFLIISACILAAANIVQAQASSAVTVALGPEAWAVILGAAITVGINLEQLRRVRRDVSDGRQQVRELNQKHDDTTASQLEFKAQINQRLALIEQGIKYLKGHERSTDRVEKS